MICPKCKNLISDNVELCPVCGYRFERAEKIAAEPSAPRTSLSSENGQIEENRQQGASRNAQARPTGAGAQQGAGPNAQARPTGAGAQQGAGRNAQARPAGAGAQQFQWQAQNMNRGPVPPFRPVEPLTPEQAEKEKSDNRIKTIIGFICGIFGLAGFGGNLAFAIVGVVFCSIVRKSYKNHGFKPDTDKKLADAGFICSVIGIAVGVIWLIALCVIGAGVGAALHSLTRSMYYY